VTAATVVRLDETVAFSTDPATGADTDTAVTSLIATWKLTPRWVPVFRQSWVRRGVSSGVPGTGSAFSNPLLGVSYVRPLRGRWRMAAFLSSTVPAGSGGGDTPDAAQAAAIAAAAPARSAMDNALFAVNYWTVIGGLDLTYLAPEVSLQAEVTVLQLTRVRGPDTQDSSRTNFTAGIHAGHFFSPAVSLGAEFRVQRWLTNAAPVRSDPAAREQFTFGIGPRLHLKVGDSGWFRPGLSYTRALDDPMAAKNYNIVQIDLPYAF
jgi:hypothetical protein